MTSHRHTDHSHNGHNHTGHSHNGHDSEAATRIVTVRPASGLSGDIMLAGLAALARLDTARLAALTEELGLPELQNSLTLEPRSVNAIAGVGCRIDLPREHAHRTLADILPIIAHSRMPDRAKERASRAFRILAEAEAAVHGLTPETVAFHEVGALDSILDICLVCRLFVELDAPRLICGPLPLADGAARCAHGRVAIPAPAVLRLLENMPVCPFPGEGETVTPTAIALLRALDAGFGPWPSMTVRATAISYGTKIFPDAPNGAIWALGDADRGGE